MKLPGWGEIGSIPFEARNDLEKFIYEFEPVKDEDSERFNKWLQRAVDYVELTARETEGEPK